MDKQLTNIYRSRKQATLAALGGAGFVCLGIFMFTRQDVTPVVHTIAIATVLFFGCCSLAGSYFLIRKKSDPIIVLSPESITIRNTDGGSYEIPWRRITDFEAKEWHGEIFLLIRVGDPDAAVAAEANPIYRKILEINNGLFGTPYCLIPATLDYPKGALLPQLRKLLKKYGTA